MGASCGRIFGCRGDHAAVAVALDTFAIDSPEHGQPFKIDLVEGLDEDHVRYIEDQWAPIIKRQYDRALLAYFTLPPARQTNDEFLDLLAKFGVPDPKWNWREKCSIAATGPNRKTYGLLNADHVEAAMMLLFGKNSRDSGLGLPLVYVDYVAVAPWNRRAIQAPERFHGLGTVMLGTAIEVSRLLGLDGRCGLHSLPSAEGFYRRIGMKDLAVDPHYHDLRYFEFDSDGATEFRKRGVV